MFAWSAPGDLELSARELDFDGGIEPPVTSAYCDSGARTRATGQRFSGATLEDAQPDVRTVDDFHETDVHAIGKARMTFDGWPEAVDRRARDRGDREHRMRIAHGYRADLHFGAGDGKRIHVRLGRRFERQRLWIETGYAHVDRDQIGVVDAGVNETGGAVEHDFARSIFKKRDLAAGMKERCHAPHPVAALLHLAAVGVEDAVVNMSAGAARRLQNHGLVETDALVAVGELAPLRRGRQAAVARCFEDDDVIARAMHFGELELHGAKNTLRFTLMRLAPVVVIALAGFAVYQLYSHRDIERAPGVLVVADPTQRDIDSAPLIERGEFRLRPRAEFDATVRVLHREDYSLGALAKLVPTDFAVGWGPMSDSAVLADIEISQANRFYFWRTETWPIDRQAIETHSANWHVIAQNSSVTRVLGGLRAGSVVELRGQLVDIEGSEGGMNTSLSRDDTGAGACEILLAESARVVER